MKPGAALSYTTVTYFRESVIEHGWRGADGKQHEVRVIARIEGEPGAVIEAQDRISWGLARVLAGEKD